MGPRALGHRRPVGTTTGRLRFDWRNDEREPQLGDVTLEDGTTRWYLVAGVEEHRDSPRVWWLILERISTADADRLLAEGAAFWSHVRYSRATRPR